MTKSKINFWRKWLALSTVLLFLICLLTASQQIKPQSAQADRLESDSYILQFGNFNTGAGITDEDDSGGNPFSHRLSYTLGQTGAGPYGDYGQGSSTYFIGSGFQYIYQIPDFSFSISDITIDFGEILPQEHETNTNELTINTRGGGGFWVYAYELRPLTAQVGTTIPDTTCDSELDPCDETEAKPWVDEQEPGFGFNVHGDTAASDFKLADSDCSLESYCSSQGEDLCPTDCYRQFADDSLGESMQSVMSSDNIATDESVTVTYQLGIEPIQAAGSYETSIVYVAVPGY